MRTIPTPDYQFCNGETEPPPVTHEDTWTLYWFDGNAKWQDTRRDKSGLLVHGDDGIDVIRGLVSVYMWRDPFQERCYPAVVNVSNPEHVPYLLTNCHGRWWGPVHAPEMRTSDEACAEATQL